jgi:hypothetical protein
LYGVRIAFERDGALETIGELAELERQERGAMRQLTKWATQ